MFPTFLWRNQCDQIWGNFPTLAKFPHFGKISNYLSIFRGCIKYLAKHRTYFCIFLMLLGKFSMLKVAKY